MEEVLFTESFLSGLGKVSSTLQGKNVLVDGKTTRSTAQKPKRHLFSTVAVLFKTKPNTSKTFLIVHEEMRVFCSLFHLFLKFNIFTCIYDSSLNCISRTFLFPDLQSQPAFVHSKLWGKNGCSFVRNSSWSGFCQAWLVWHDRL